MVEQKIIEAIQNRRMISFTYVEQDARREIRMAAPHALFISSAENMNMDALQYEGYSKKGDLPAWRQFTIDNIRNLVLLDGHFNVAQGYNPYSGKYRNSIHKI